MAERGRQKRCQIAEWARFVGLGDDPLYVLRGRPAIPTIRCHGDGFHRSGTRYEKPTGADDPPFQSDVGHQLQVFDVRRIEISDMASLKGWDAMRCLDVDTLKRARDKHPVGHVAEPKNRSTFLRPTRWRTHPGRGRSPRPIEHPQAMGANAVAGVRFDSSDIGNDMSEILAYGTAVLSPAPRPEAVSWTGRLRTGEARGERWPSCAPRRDRRRQRGSARPALAASIRNHFEPLDIRSELAAGPRPAS